MSRKKSGKPTAKELQTLGIATKGTYGGQRFPPPPKPKEKPPKRGPRPGGRG